MKKNVTLLLALLIGTFHQAFSQWNHVDFTINLDGQYDIYFLDANTGFTIGDYSNGSVVYNRIYRTTDGATTWTKVFEVSDPAGGMSTHSLRSLAFTSSSVGFCAGSQNGINPYICKTTNGGVTWSATSLPFNGAVKKIVFPSNNVGYMCGDPLVASTVLYKTIDGGSTWTDIAVSAAATMTHTSITDIQFLDDNNGFATTAPSSSTQAGIYKTTDGGLTWSQIYTIAGNNKFLALHFINSTTGFAAATVGKVYKTIDGGANWTLIAIPAAMSYDVQDIYFFSPLVGYAASINSFFSGGIYKTTNGGTTWALDSSPGFSIPINFYSFAFAGGKGYACGIGGYAKTNSAPLVGINELNKDIAIDIYPNPATDYVVVKIKDEVYLDHMKISFFNVLGEKTKEIPLQHLSSTIETNDLNPGVYFYELSNEMTTVKTGKIIIK